MTVALDLACTLIVALLVLFADTFLTQRVPFLLPRSPFPRSAARRYNFFMDLSSSMWLCLGSFTRPQDNPRA